DVALQVIADHGRACTFLIGDGVMPSNEGRGYVLRRIARRAIRFGVRLGLTEPFMAKVATLVIAEMGNAYPELHERASFIEDVMLREELRFRETLDKGLVILENALNDVPQGSKLSGDVVFLLHDTFGFPRDLTQLIASERSIAIDVNQYNQRMEEQRAAGRANWKGSGESALEHIIHELSTSFQTDFLGYNGLLGTAVIEALIDAEGQQVNQLRDKGRMVVSQTPFYAESGGQVGDIGVFKTRSSLGNILDVQKPAGQVFLHEIDISEGQIAVGDEIQLVVSDSHRADTRRNHTATHLLHAALRKILGTHVTQKGSLVEPERLRFDFSHHKGVTQEEIFQIQNAVQVEIQKNTAIETDTCTMDEAKGKGALALFGEKYGDIVRVVQIPGFSTELCGGTHAQYTGEIGIFLITSESSVSAGVRRIEAITGNAAIERLQSNERLIKSIQNSLRTQPHNILEQIQVLIDERRQLKSEIANLTTEIARLSAGDLLELAEDINGMKVIAAEFSGSVEAMREEADRLRSKLGSGVVVLGSTLSGVKLIAAVTKDIAGKKAHAGKLIKAISPLIGGGGGGGSKRKSRCKITTTTTTTKPDDIPGACQ
ncbi:MAG: alanine--tRNA ligase, partial [Myxococcota bacterium]|nr:alanine--tRNA ligase [Myxococcota bacterium]